MDSPTAAPPSGGALRNLVLMAVVALATLVVCELLVRAFVPVRNVGPAFSTYDPVYGKRLKANLDVERITPEFRFRLRTNSLGYRGPEPSGPLTDVVLFLGDSFTMGYGVEDDEAFPAVVGRMLQAAAPATDWTVVNAGIGNSGNGRWLKFLARAAPALEPRAVVLQVMSNDFGDNRAEGLYALRATGGLVARPIREPGPLRKLQGWIEEVPGLSYSHLLGLVKMAMVGGGARRAGAPPDQAEAEPLADAATAPAAAAGAATGPAEAPAQDRLTYALVDAAVQRAQARGWPVLVVGVGLDGPREARLRALLSAREVPYIHVATKDEAPELYFTIDGHWNADGHRVAARLITEALLRMGI